MTRLFAAMCNEPERIGCALYPAREALVTSEAEGGWGLAFFQGGEVLLQRHPKKPSTPVDFFAAIRSLKTDYLIGHGRDGKVEAGSKLENTQPFRYRSWVFAHVGEVAQFDAIRTPMLENVPDFLKRNIRGQTESEHLFHLFLAFLHDAGKLDDANLSIGDGASALRAMTAVTDRLVTGAGGKPGSTALAATNGRILLAVTRGAPTWIRKQSGVADCELCRGDGDQRAREGRQRKHHELLRSVLIVNEPAKVSGDGWEQAADASVIGVTRDLQTSVSPLAPA